MDIFIVALLLVVGIAAWLFYKKTNRLAPTSTQPTLRLQGGGKYEFAVMGVARYRPAFEKICGNDQRDPKIVEALLVLEDTESHDKKAVRVEVQGRTVGYLPTDIAEAYRKRLLESGYPGARSICNAKIIVRMHSSIGGNADYALRLDLPQKRSSGK
jgi:hypothetical protein